MTNGMRLAVWQDYRTRASSSRECGRVRMVQVQVRVQVRAQVQGKTTRGRKRRTRRAWLGCWGVAEQSRAE
jgi:hypothetical protein